MADVFLTSVDDINRKILLLLDDEDLFNSSETNKHAAMLCENDDFWRERILRIFKVDLTNFIEENLTYRQIYQILRQIRDEHYLEITTESKNIISACHSAIFNKHENIAKYLIVTKNLGLHVVICDTCKPIMSGQEIRNLIDFW